MWDYICLQLADLLAIKNLIRARKPHAIVIGGESRDALMIQEDLREIIQDLIIEDSFPDISVEIVDNQLAKVYSSSLKAEVSTVFVLQACFFFELQNI